MTERDDRSGPAIEPVFVERELTLRAPGRGRKKQAVRVRFGVPEPDRGDYRCVFEISGLREQPIVRCLYGVDGIQALTCAMKMAAHELSTSRAYGEGRLTWLGDPDLSLLDAVTTASGRGRLPSPGTGARRRAPAATSGRRRRR